MKDYADKLNEPLSYDELIEEGKRKYEEIKKAKHE
jgi:hypothetical protein